MHYVLIHSLVSFYSGCPAPPGEQPAPEKGEKGGEEGVGCRNTPHTGDQAITGHTLLTKLSSYLEQLLAGCHNGEVLLLLYSRHRPDNLMSGSLFSLDLLIYVSDSLLQTAKNQV